MPTHGSKLDQHHRRERIQHHEGRGLRSASAIRDQLAKEGIEVTVRTVERDIAALDALWSAATVAERDRHKRRQVSRSEARYAELEAEWQRSKKDAEKSRTKETSGGEEGAAAGKTETEATVQGRIAEVQLMRAMLAEEQHQAELLALYPPKKMEHSGPEGKPIPVEMAQVVVRTRTEASELLSRLRPAGSVSGRD